MNSHINPHWIVADIEPSIALARAQCLQTYRTLPGQKEPDSDELHDVRGVHAMYLRDLLGGFSKFLLSWLQSPPSPRHDALSYTADLQPSASTVYPRGA
jgi:hypothetical protein